MTATVLLCVVWSRRMKCSSRHYPIAAYDTWHVLYVGVKRNTFPCMCSRLTGGLDHADGLVRLRRWVIDSA